MEGVPEPRYQKIRGVRLGHSLPGMGTDAAPIHFPAGGAYMAPLQ
jgi:hypothetical protein